MYKLSFLILLFLVKIVTAQSPHGADFNYECQECHTTDTWKISSSKLNFEHAQTGFELIGQHKVLDCQSCHSAWEFSNTPQDCYQCHTDIHNNTVSKSCDNCHSSKSWVIENINDVHRMSRFPLVGAHQQADCQDCHKSFDNLQFEQLGIDCIDCHISDYESSTLPNHREANFSNDCQQCHLITDQQWSRANFEHSFFPLEGGHKISNCFDCHSQNNFEGLTQDCIVCHQNDYNSTTNPNHSNLNFSKNCLDCHSTNPNWRPTDFRLHDSFYPLLGAHKTIANDCAKCHSTGYENTPTDCFSCHKQNYENTANPNHKSAGFSTDCESCHNLNAWQPASFDHDNQFFPIYSGKHNGKWNDCSDCHSNSSNFQIFECVTCHEHNQTDMDDNHKEVNGYIYQSTACLACHPTGDEGNGFSHSTTQFPLTGAHVSVDCSTCHTNGYSGTSTECFVCHENKYASAVNPNHSSAGVDTKCEVCHTTNAWQPSTFSHTTTGFELAGGHNLPQCSSCHSGSTSNASSDCFSCHAANYTSAPEHVSQNYPKECEQCHNTTDWKQTTFNHSTTQFPLTGAHVSVDCSTCHTNGYSGTSTECFVCHENKYASAVNPNHSSAGVDTKCEVCHTTNAWQPSTFSHTTTGFELAGGHNLPQCSSCHSGSTSNASSDCFSCHAANYTSAPEHVSQNYPKECEQCHNTTDWKQTTFNHSATQFPLTGAHVSVDCSTCHTNGYSGTSTECFACHENKYASAVNPNHSSAGVDTKCEDCHTTNAWQPSPFNHTTTGFELAGGHNLPQCSSCHSGNTSNASSDCFSCHAANYTSAPEHVSQNYPKECEQCHNTTDWKQTTFNHSATQFPLTGAHVSVDCSTCHTNGYSGTSTECFACHENKYASSVNPNHSSAGVDTKCEDCHTTNAWQPSTFNHTTTGFELAGGHNLPQCSSCHSGNTSNASSDCFSCHAANYNSTTNPSHQSSGFGTQCQDCHQTNAWTPATFDHDAQFFPIYSGKHREKWNNCNDCHTNANDFSQFSCFTCHEHNQTDTDKDHKEVNGYSYVSTACLSCHPTGDDSAFLKFHPKVLK